jgi:hypothetical protein
MEYQVWSGALFLQDNPMAQAVFEGISRDLGISGCQRRNRMDAKRAVELRD